MLKLTELEFSETLELDKTIHLKGGSPSNIYNSEVDVSSDEIYVETDFYKIDLSTIDLDLSRDIPTSSNNTDFQLLYVHDWGFYESDLEADVAVTYNN